MVPLGLSLELPEPLLYPRRVCLDGVSNRESMNQTEGTLAVSLRQRHERRFYLWAVLVREEPVRACARQVTHLKEHLPSKFKHYGVGRTRDESARHSITCLPQPASGQVASDAVESSRRHSAMMTDEAPAASAISRRQPYGPTSLTPLSADGRSGGPGAAASDGSPPRPGATDRFFAPVSDVDDLAVSAGGRHSRDLLEASCAAEAHSARPHEGVRPIRHR